MSIKVEKLSADCIVINADISANKPLKLFLHSDVHFDNPKCNRDLYFETLDLAKKQGRKSLCFGDFFCAMQGKYDPRRSKSDIRAEHNVSNYLDVMVKDSADKMRKYKDDFLLISEVNHESSIRRNCETDILDRFLERLGGNTARGKYQGWVKINLHSPGKIKTSSTRTINLFYHHGKFGGIVTKGVLGVGRYGLIAPDADIIVTGHCFDNKTEILTPGGWVTHDKLDIGVKVATYNIDSKKLEFQKCNSVHRYSNYSELTKINAKGFDLLVTDEHGLILKKRKSNKIIKCKASEFKKNSEVSIFNACESYDQTKVDLSNAYLRLLVWIVADGTFDDGRIRWHLKKQRKVNRLCELLDSMPLVYSFSKTKSGTYRIDIAKSESEIISNIIAIDKSKKFLSEYLYKCNSEQSKVVIEEYSHTDGSIAKKGNGIVLYSKDIRNLDLLQSLSIRIGRKATLYPHNDCYRLNISGRDSTFFSKYKENIVDHDGSTVWCVNVPNGSLVVRRNGCVSITQNTHDKWMVEQPRFRLKSNGEVKIETQLHIKTGTYKEEFLQGSGWANERIVMPKSLGGYFLDINIHGRDRRVVYDIKSV